MGESARAAGMGDLGRNVVSSNGSSSCLNKETKLVFRYPVWIDSNQLQTSSRICRIY